MECLYTHRTIAVLVITIIYTDTALIVRPSYILVAEVLNLVLLHLVRPYLSRGACGLTLFTIIFDSFLVLNLVRAP